MTVLLDEVPEDKKCEECYVPLRLYYATYWAGGELWIYECPACERKYVRLLAMSPEP